MTARSPDSTVRPTQATPPPSSDRWRRDRDGGIVGGVLSGLGIRLGVDPVILRVGFVMAVVVTGGVALIAYGIAWAVLRTGAAPGTSRRLGPGTGHRWQLALGVALLALAVLLVFRELGIWWSDTLGWPIALAAGGAALLWGQPRSAPAPASGAVGMPAGHGAAQVARSAETARVVDLYRGGFGIALVIGAALLFLSANDALGAARDAAFTAIVAVIALGLILLPFIWRLGRNLASERAERIRSQERAELAAHLHDSVLQTLTLMQKRTGDPREMAALARRQERELRSWLSDGPVTSEGGLAGGIRSAAEEVEDAHRVKIDVVTVGECELDAPEVALIAATREALTNAAKFAGQSPISLYLEVGEEKIEAFVRDRGPGFDPERIPADRRGVRESMIGRLQRHRGSVRFDFSSGSGAEVQLTLPRERR